MLFKCHHHSVRSSCHEQPIMLPSWSRSLGAGSAISGPWVPHRWHPMKTSSFRRSSLQRMRRLLWRRRRLRQQRRRQRRRRQLLRRQPPPKPLRPRRLSGRRPLRYSNLNCTQGQSSRRSIEFARCILSSSYACKQLQQKSSMWVRSRQSNVDQWAGPVRLMLIQSAL